MAIQRKYRKETAVIANYNTITIATGRGIVELYAGDFQSGASKQLSDLQWYSDVGYYLSLNTQANLIFPMEVQRPCIIDGDCIVNVPIIWQNSVASPQTLTNTFEVGIWVSGATLSKLVSETQIADSPENMATGQAVYEMLAFKPSIPRTVVRKGQFVELRVSGAAIAANKNYYILFDPKNRSRLSGAAMITYEAGSQLTAKMPFVTT